MPSEKTVTVVLLGIAAAGLLAVTGYNLWIAPPAQGLEAVRLEEPAGESSWFAELDEPVVPDAEHPLDVNSATEEELALLPGIGETLAGRIAAYREEHGPFSAPEDLLLVEGIGEKTLAGFRDRVTVGSPE